MLLTFPEHTHTPDTTRRNQHRTHGGAHVPVYTSLHTVKHHSRQTHGQKNAPRNGTAALTAKPRIHHHLGTMSPP